MSGIGSGGTPSGGSVCVAPKHNVQRTVIYCERIFIHLIPVLLSGSHGSFFADYCKDRMLHYYCFPLLSDFSIASENAIKPTEVSFLDQYAILRTPGIR